MILYGNNSGKFIKVTHRNLFNEEDGQIDNTNNRVKSSINTLRMNVNNDSNLRKVNNFLNQYKQMTIDTTNHGQVKSNKPIRNVKVVRNIGFISSMNR